MAESKKWTLLRKEGVDALCGHVKTIRENQALLAQTTMQALKEADEALDQRQPITGWVPLTIPTDGWVTDGSVPGFSHAIDLPVPDISGAGNVDVHIFDAATAANFWAVTESSDGKLRLRAAQAPTREISAEYHVTKTAVEKEE